MNNLTPLRPFAKETDWGHRLGNWAAMLAVFLNCGRRLAALALVAGTVLLSHAAAASNCSLYQEDTLIYAAGFGERPTVALPVTLDVGEKLKLKTVAQFGGGLSDKILFLGANVQGEQDYLLYSYHFDYIGSGTESAFIVASRPLSNLRFSSYATGGGTTWPVSLYFKCIPTTYNSTISLESSSATSTTGSSVTFTATVSNADDPGITPTGAVEFFDGGNSLGTAAVSGGVAQLTTSALSIATHSITAHFLGDSYYPSTSAAVSHAVTDPSAVDTALVLTASNLEPYINETFTLQATVSAAIGAPTGTVKFLLAGVGVIGEAPLIDGVARISFSSIYRGANGLSAEYAATPGFKASSGSLVVDVQVFATETTITISKNPTRPGESFTATITVMDLHTNAVVSDGAVALFIDGQSAVGGRRISGQPIRYTLPFLPPRPQLPLGEHEIKAVYSGGAYASSQAVVLQRIENTELATVTTLTSSKNPAAPDEAVPFMASVTVSDTGANATGNVEFYNGATLLGTVALVNGVASVSSSFSDVGELQITARYLGEANAFAASTSAALTQRIDKFGTSVSLSSTPNPSQQGQEVSLTATVTSAAGTPAGTVEFFDGAVSLGTAPLSSGSAVLTTSALDAGSHDLTAAYSGSTSEAASTSAVLPHNVGTESAKLDKVQQQATQAVAGVSADVITDITSEVISDALGGQVQVLSASDGKVGLTWAPGLTRGGTMIQPTADGPTTTDSSWRFWVKGRYTDWDAGSLDGKLWNGMAGASMLFGDGMVAGLVAGYEHYDYESTAASTLKGDGLSLGGYVGGKLSDSLTFDTQLHTTVIGYDVASGGVTGDFDAMRLIAAGGFSYALHEGALSFTPTLRASGMWEWQDGYVDSAAVAHGARGFGNARASGGARVAYTIPLSDGGRLTPYVSGFGDWRVSDGDQTTDSALDGLSGRIESGFDLQTRGGINFGASVEFMGLGIEDTLATSYRANLSIPF